VTLAGPLLPTKSQLKKPFQNPWEKPRKKPVPPRTNFRPTSKNNKAMHSPVQESVCMGLYLHHLGLDVGEP
jgi:hypothetical protein